MNKRLETYKLLGACNHDSIGLHIGHIRMRADLLDGVIVEDPSVSHWIRGVGVTDNIGVCLVADSARLGFLCGPLPVHIELGFGDITFKFDNPRVWNYVRHDLRFACAVSGAQSRGRDRDI